MSQANIVHQYRDWSRPFLTDRYLGSPTFIFMSAVTQVCWDESAICDSNACLNSCVEYIPQ